MEWSVVKIAVSQIMLSHKKPGVNADRDRSHVKEKCNKSAVAEHAWMCDHERNWDKSAFFGSIGQMFCTKNKRDNRLMHQSLLIQTGSYVHKMVLPDWSNFPRHIQRDLDNDLLLRQFVLKHVYDLRFLDWPLYPIRLCTTLLLALRLFH